MHQYGMTVALAALLLAAPGCKDRKRSPTNDPKPNDRVAAAVAIDDRNTCKECHEAIAAELETSMHSRAHHSRDPIYAAVRTVRIGREGDAIAAACARCHTPGFEKQPEDPAAARGVTCSTCHNALVGAEPGQLLGSHDVAHGATPAHGTGAAAKALADGTTLCMSCHDRLDSPSNVSICATGAEHSELPQATRQSCASCHMPKVDGAPTATSARTTHASHAFLGPHHAWYHDDSSFVAKSVELKAAFEGGRLRIELSNLAGHSFPTGFPGRVAVLRAVGRDAQGADVWSPEAIVLGKVYVDADGKPTMAPYAVRLDKDTRLAPGAKQSYPLEPPAQVATVEITLAMRLLPERLAAKLKLGDAPEATPKTLIKVGVSR